MHYQITFPVRYYEADPMGIVHHSEYIRYFELARDAWLREVGYTHDRCLAEHLVFPVVSLDCRYFRSARFGQDVTVTMDLDEFKGAKVTFLQRVLDPDGQVCAEGHVTLGFINTELGRPVRCPETLSALLG
ncbi:MAG: acyl-CoA thioesterase [Bacteroidales bacterium]|nr:acyl-CoA thioesterase [Bacteroidales bacterium]